MIDKSIQRKHIEWALAFIDTNGVPPKRKSTKFNILNNGLLYPPKYTLSLAAEQATGKEMKPSDFNGGNEANEFLHKLGFTIVDKYGQSIYGEALAEKHSVSSITQQKGVITNPKHTVSICSALLQIPKYFSVWQSKSYDYWLSLLEHIIKNTPSTSDILLLPAGYFCLDSNSPVSISDLAKTIILYLKNYNQSLTVCLGIDDFLTNKQLAFAVDTNQVLAAAQKFHHMDHSVDLAEDPFINFNGHSRFLNINGITFYLAVCYDLFGINHLELESPEPIDGVLGMIHGFDSAGSAVDFARKGLAGASKQLGVNTYASSVFAMNTSPKNWPAGVEWKYGNDSVRSKKYDDIALQCTGSILEFDYMKVYFKLYTLNATKKMQTQI